MDFNWEFVKTHPEIFGPLGLACFLLLVVGLNVIGNLIGEGVVQFVEQRKSRRKTSQRQTQGDRTKPALAGFLALVLFATVAGLLTWYFGRDTLAMTPTTLHDLAKFFGSGR